MCLTNIRMSFLDVKLNVDSSRWILLLAREPGSQA